MLHSRVAPRPIWTPNRSLLLPSRRRRPLRAAGGTRLIPPCGVLRKPLVVEGGGGGGDVAHSGEANQTVNFSGAAGFTIPNQTSAGSNRFGVLHIGGFVGATGATSATWGGTAMTLTHLGANGDALMFHVVAPATAASDVIVSNLSGANGQAVASTYVNADQSAGSGPISNSNTATATSTTASVTVTTASGEMVVDACGYDASATGPTIGANQVLLLNTEANNGGDLLASYQLGADGGVATWDFPGSIYWEQVAASIKKAA